MARGDLRKKADEIIDEVRGETGGTSGAQIAKSPKGNLLSFFKLHKGEHERTSLQLDGILNILKKNNQLEKKEAEEDRKEREREKREKREKLLESLKGGVNSAASAGKKIVSTLVSPFSNIWQAITKFLKTVLIGVLFNQALFWFSKEENQKKMERVWRFMKFWWPSLLAGYALFFTPIGNLVSGVASILSFSLPLLAGLILKYPLLATLVGTGILTSAWLKNKMDNKDKAVSPGGEEENTQEFSTGGLVSGSDSGPVQEFSTGGLVSGSDSGPVQEFSTGGFVSRPSGRDRGPVQEFSTGGFVSGPSGRDRVPAKLTAGEFVMSKGAVQKYGADTLAGMNAAGGGTNRGGPRYEGGGLVDAGNMWGKGNWMKSWQSNGGTSRWTPNKARGMTPVGTPNRRSTTTTTTLPPISAVKPKESAKRGDTTIPTFSVITHSSLRAVNMMALGIGVLM